MISGIVLRSVQEVRYYIGQYDLPGQPSLRNGDVTWASSQWSDISFNNQTTKFRYIYAGTTHRGVPVQDNVNYVDYGTLPDVREVAAAFPMLDPNNNDRIVEIDIVFNYHNTNGFKAHGTVGAKHCLRNVAAHEFGHGIGLWHCDSGVCPPYASYTMSADRKPPDTHSHEDLECEDKYMAWYIYNVMGSPVHNPDDPESPEEQWIKRMEAEAGGAPPIPLLVANLNADVSVLPTETKLYQNYPSPFNPETWIPYELGKDTQVTLIISDSTGHSVKTIDLGVKPAGRYLTKDKAIYWDGTNDHGERVHSDVYYYTLKGEDFLYTGKMLLVK